MEKSSARDILEARIRQMADGSAADNDFSLEDFDPAPSDDGTEVPRPMRTTKKESLRSRREKPEVLTIETYEQLFLSNRPIDYRTSFPINKSTLDILRKVLRDMESRTSLSSFIDNILLHHLQTYRALINKATEEKLRQPTIPNI